MRWIVDHHIRAWNVIQWGARLYEGYDMAHVHKLHEGYRNILGRAYSSALLSLVIASFLMACGGPTVPDASATPAGTTIPGGDTNPPTAPAGLAAAANGSFGAFLSWAASTDNVAVAGYEVQRCQGAGCATFAQVVMAGSASFTDSGLTAATPYSYRVRATDAAANFGAFSNIANVTTAAAPGVDTTPPTAPGSLATSPDGSFGATLSWTASTDNVAVTGYKVERCQGAGCATFAQVATAAGASFTDSGLTATTSYSYRVRATDAAANLSAYSNTANVTTSAPPPPPLANLPAWMNGLAVGVWLEIPSTSLSSIDPSPLPLGNLGPAAKVEAWTSFVIDTRTSKVYSVANGGHADYGGNEVDELNLELAQPAWVQRLAPTPNNQIVGEATYYSDGRPTSRHTYYGATFNEAGDRIMLVGGARFGFQQGFGISTTDSYNITANNYSPAGTHPDISPGAITAFIGFNTTGNPLTGDIYSFGNFASGKWTRTTNTWAALGASGTGPYGQESMSAVDTNRGRIFILGGRSEERHILTLSTKAFTQITLAGPNAASVAGENKGAMVYVPALDSYLIRLAAAGGAVYQVQAATFTVTPFVTINGGSIPGTLNGPFNKFLYVPRLGGCVYVPSYAGNAWL